MFYVCFRRDRGKAWEAPANPATSSVSTAVWIDKKVRFTDSSFRTESLRFPFNGRSGPVFVSGFPP